MITPEQEVLLRPHGDRRLLRVHVEDHAGHRGDARAQLLGDRRQGFDVRRGRDDVHHRLAGAAPFAHGREAQEPGARILIVDGEPARAGLSAQLAEQRVHRLRLQMTALDVQDHVVAVGLMQPDLGPVTTRHDRELHLVAVPVRIGGGQDGPELELAEPTDPLEAVAHLLFLEPELGGVRKVLESAAAAAAEVGAGGFDSIRGGRLERLDHRAPESRARLDDPDPQTVARDRAADEEDVALDPTDPFATECEVVDRQIEDVATPRFCHD